MKTKIRIPSNVCHEILPNLLLGNQLSTQFADQLGVDFIVSIGSKSKASTIQNLHIGLKDDKTLNIQNKLAQVIPLIHELLNSGKKVLVHCKAGMNRSPSFVLAYVCKYSKMTIEDGIVFISSKRSICKFSMKDQVEIWLSSTAY